MLKLLIAVAMLCVVRQTNADFVALGGSGYLGEDSGMPSYPFAAQFSIGDETDTVLPLPQGLRGEISYVAVDSIRGWVIYVGEESGSGDLLIFRGSVLTSKIESVPVPAGLTGELNGVAIDSEGTAVIAGYNSSADLPLILRLPLGAASAVQVPVTGSGIDGGTLETVAIAPGNVAVLAGQGSNAPLIYALAPGAAEPTVVSIPDPSISGGVAVMAVGPNGTAILGGTDFTNDQAFIYSLPAYSGAASSISIPDPGDGGNLYCIAIGPDNTAILGGENNTGLLIYRVSPGASSAVVIGNPTDDEGAINGVAIGSDGTAILGGEDDTAERLLFARLSPGASNAVLIPPPSGIRGIISAVSIGAQDIAVLAGSRSGGSTGVLIFTLPLHSDEISSVASQISLNSNYIDNIAIYPCNGLYDVRRMRPYYYLQQDRTVNKLNSAEF